MNLNDRLSKSRYMKGLRCPLALYLSVHHYDLASEPTPAQQGRFDVGHEVGELTQRRFPGGVLIAEDHLHHAEAVEATQRALAEDAPTIFEAAFTHDNVKVRVDVLHALESGGYELIEVKSTSKYDEAKHLPDAAVQLHVLLGSGLDVRRVALMHLDRTYVYPGGEYDPHELLTSTDITREAFAYIEGVPAHLAEMMHVLALPEAPRPPAGISCQKPYECEFLAWCTREAEVAEPVGELVTDPAVLSRLEKLPFPLHFVDFETINPALPVFPGTSPFQVAKVQWSVHTLLADGTLEHAEYLFEDDSQDPAPEFMRTLLDSLGHEGTFVHYSAYERTQLVDIAVRYPEFRQRLVDRIPAFFSPLVSKLVDAGLSSPALHKPKDGGLLAFDLGMRVVRDGCSHPVLGLGGWSIKKAIKVLAPELPPYEGLAVSNGDQAMLATLEMMSAECPTVRAEQIRADLLEYCRQDTLAMVEIYRTLEQIRLSVA